MWRMTLLYFFESDEQPKAVLNKRLPGITQHAPFVPDTQGDEEPSISEPGDNCGAPGSSREPPAFIR